MIWADGRSPTSGCKYPANSRDGPGGRRRLLFRQRSRRDGHGPANAAVNSTDELAVAATSRRFSTQPRSRPYDFNRDGLVNATDQILTRSNATTLATALKLISVPASLAEPHSPPAGAVIGVTDPSTAAIVAVGLTAPCHGGPVQPGRPPPVADLSLQQEVLWQPAAAGGRLRIGDGRVDRRLSRSTDE